MTQLNHTPLFMKANALGNDFILIKMNCSSNEAENHEILQKHNIIKIADRKLGIGADQILALDNDNMVHIWNQDGSKAKMCGNGLRCLGKWIFEQNLLNKNINTITLKTVSGPITLTSDNENIKLNMPFCAKITKNDDAYIVDVGNLHKIKILSSNPKDLSEHADNNYNVSCIWLENNICNARTWELGAGETFACGSAAFSIASVLDAMNEKNLDVYFKLGIISHEKKNNEIIQTGPANLVAKIEFI